MTAAGTLRAAPAAATADRPLRIAHVLTNFTTGSGGITLRGAAALDGDRFTSTIVAPAQTGTLFEAAEEAGIAVVKLRRMGGARRVYPARDFEALREVVASLSGGDFDIVHTHAGRAGALGRVAARWLGVPAIVHTLHGFPFNDFQNRATRAALRRVERELGRITDYFVTDGTFVASEAVRLKIARPERVRAVVSPIDPVPQATAQRRLEARALLGIPADATVIGTTARLARQKAPLDMVRAFVALGRRDVYMIWVGGGDLHEKTQRLVERHDLGGRFVLLGDRTDAVHLLPAFDVFVMPSLWEGLPCSIVEAMTCGIPVVATAVNSVPEVVIPGRTGLLARPGDPSSLTRALAYMLDHPREARRMAETARLEIGEQYRADLLGREFASIYDAALQFAEERGPRAAVGRR